MKTTKQAMALALVALVTFGAAILLGCKEDEKPTAQVNELKNVPTTSGTVNININYTGFAGTTPDYMSNLEAAAKGVASMATANNITLTIDVVSEGDDGFVSTGPKTLSVGENWLSGKTEQQIGQPLGSIMIPWFAMMGSNVRGTVRLANATVPQYNRAMMLRNNGNANDDRHQNQL